jgi:hypothetical protein
MNLARHASVLWRFRRVTAAGVVLGIVLAILASYRVSSSGLQPRGSAVYSAVSSIWVTQPGFPEGRVTLPEQQISEAVTAGGEDAVEENASPSDQVEFADPARLASLGDLYSKLLTSDEVLRRVKAHPSPATVTASPFAASQGGLLLPVIQLTTMGGSPAGAVQTNRAVYRGLLDFLDEEADRNDVAKARRVELKVLNAPEVGLISGPKPTMSVVAFMMVMLGTLAVTHLLEALRNRRETEALATIVDWDAPTPLDQRRNGDSVTAADEPELAGGRRKR